MSLTLRVIGAVLVLTGALGSVLASFLDQVTLTVILVFPVVVIKGPLGIISFLVLFFGLFVLFGDMLLSKRLMLGDGARPGRTRRKGDESDGGATKVTTEGIIFLGPIPIFIGRGGRNKDRLSWWALLMVGMIIMLFFNIIMVIIAMMWL